MRAGSGALTGRTLARPPCESQQDTVLARKRAPDSAGADSRPCVLGYSPMRVVEKRQLLSAQEIDRTLQRVAHEIVEKSGGAKDLAFVGVRRRGVPLSQRLAKAIKGFSGIDVPVGIL